MRTSVAIVVFWASVASGATNQSASTSWADVSNAVYLASAGDTISIPAGTSSWNGTLTIGKAVSLIGSGTNSTQFIYTNKQILIWSGMASNAAWRMNGITFSNAGVSASTYWPVKVQGPTLNGRIDRCKFVHGSSPIWLNGRVEGVFDHNFFINCEQGFLLVGDETNSWLRAIVPGTTNCSVIEDNVFYLDDAGALPIASHNQDVYHQGGARSATRYNSWQHTGYSGVDSFYDSHGLWASGQAQPICEFYLNTVSAQNSTWYDLADTRGGSALWWSNTFTVNPSPGIQYALKLICEAISGCQSPWPCQQQVSNTFLWGNTFNGTLITQARISNDNTNDPTIISQNRDYWMEAPNSTNGLPAGIYNGYTPLTYPHPRVTAEDNPSALLPRSSLTGNISLGGNTRIGP